MRGMIYTSGMKEVEEKAVEMWKGSGKTGKGGETPGTGSGAVEIHKESGQES